MNLFEMQAFRMVFHIDTADDSLAGELVRFVHEVDARTSQRAQ